MSGRKRRNNPNQRQLFKTGVRDWRLTKEEKKRGREHVEELRRTLREHPFEGGE